MLLSFGVLPRHCTHRQADKGFHLFSLFRNGFGRAVVEQLLI